MKYFIICATMILFSCIESNGKKQVQQKKEIIQKSSEMNEIFPYTDKNVGEFYTFSTEQDRYIVTADEKKMNNFQHDKLILPIKENDFEIIPTVKDKYAITETLSFSSSIFCKVIVYNTIGDNDTPILNVQLDSYYNGQLRDQLLLDSRFTFETEYYRTFVINKDKSIKINKFSVNKLEFNEAGDILGEKKVADTVKVTVDYKLTDEGYFKKL
ncbi:hypothetical protein [Kaistella carnis]|uniref:hypothetical protein n=1 Tax=Kaistella carnis TaxID=1241979 RepID=UPI0028A7F42D|nr:hypothetical protein [Kaistella carnis]